VKNKILDFAYWFCALLVRFLFFLNGGLTIIGRENIPYNRGVIIALNHVSYLDPPLVGAVLPRRATFLARRGLFSIPLLGSFVRLFALPLDREHPQPSIIKETIKRLTNGGLIVIFPEGRRSDTGELQSASQGVGLLASRGNASVVPALITGSDKALPPGAKWLRRARISILFDRPIYASSTIEKGGGTRYQYRDITEKVMSAIRDLQKRTTSG
jgi:1-acyl-sn-glycerol-3-phosphate acyltransferase